MQLDSWLASTICQCPGLADAWACLVRPSIASRWTGPYAMPNSSPPWQHWSKGGQTGASGSVASSCAVRASRGTTSASIACTARCACTCGDRRSGACPSGYGYRSTFLASRTGCGRRTSCPTRSPTVGAFGPSIWSTTSTARPCTSRSTPPSPRDAWSGSSAPSVSDRCPPDGQRS